MRARELMDKPKKPQLLPDHLGEDRHELVAKLAYKFWEERGRPFGSPETDWFRAEQEVYFSLLAAGLITESEGNSKKITEKIYR
jgi:hypothetical protein